MAIPLYAFKNTEGKFMKYADGGYPILYMDKHDSVFCPDCANKLDPNGEIPDDPIIAGDIFYEGPEIECDGGCGTMIQSAYGDPDEEDLPTDPLVLFAMLENAEEEVPKRDNA